VLQTQIHHPSSNIQSAFFLSLCCRRPLSFIFLSLFGAHAVAPSGGWTALPLILFFFSSSLSLFSSHLYSPVLFLPIYSPRCIFSLFPCTLYSSSTGHFLSIDLFYTKHIWL
jgi:hypothetical protein